MFASFNKLFFRFSITIVVVTTFLSSAFAHTISFSPVKIRLKDGSYKFIQMQKINLSVVQRKDFSQKITLVLKAQNLHLKKPSSLLPMVENGMNGVPVLDQGMWGTCATFSTAAALDALYSLYGSDAVSELCNLELGRTLKNPDEDGGWSGSTGFLVLQQIQQYGYIPQSLEATKMCGGLSEYPGYQAFGNGDPMPVAVFTGNSLKSFTHADWQPLFSYGENHLLSLDANTAVKILEKTKSYLSGGNRVLIGTLLVPEVGVVGAVGKFHEIDNDTWVLTNVLKDYLADSTKDDAFAGHAMVITGYDDNACAQYTVTKNAVTETQQQCGLFHLRNSWTTLAGDNGDYYMTYDYFKAMVLELDVLGRGINTRY